MSPWPHRGSLARQATPPELPGRRVGAIATVSIDRTIPDLKPHATKIFPLIHRAQPPPPEEPPPHPEETPPPPEETPPPPEEPPPHPEETPPHPEETPLHPEETPLHPEEMSLPLEEMSLTPAEPPLHPQSAGRAREPVASRYGGRAGAVATTQPPAATVHPPLASRTPSR